MNELDTKEIVENLGENFGPVLRSSKKKGEMSWRGQVDEILKMHTL